MKLINKLKKELINLKIQLKFKKNNVVLQKGTFITEYVSIGYGTRFNGPAYLAGNEESHIIIGNYNTIAFNLRIRTRNHDINYPCMQNSLLSRLGIEPKYLCKKKGNVQIGHGCWIGDNVIILPGVKIGNGAVIGAGSIVTRDIPSYAVAVGSPAKVINYRCNDETIQILEESRWWEWDEKKMLKNKSFFNTKLNELTVDNFIN